MICLDAQSVSEISACPADAFGVGSELFGERPRIAAWNTHAPHDCSSP